MSKVQLTEDELKILTDCINQQTELPEELLVKLGPSFFDKLRQAGRFDYRELDRFKIPTIEYAGKRSEAVILAQAGITGGAAPLQIVRSFANGKNGDWKNLIVQGDNLQFLKTCYLNRDALIRDKVKGKVTLIYIDPPFATESEFGGKSGERSYSDTVATAEFIECLRERLIYLREILANDGSIYVHLDQRMNAYIRVVMDEIFGRNCFVNEITWKRTYAHSGAKQYGVIHDSILYYSAGGERIWNVLRTAPDEEYIQTFFDQIEEGTGRRYARVDLTAAGITKEGDSGKPWRGIDPKAKGRHWAFQPSTLDKLDKEHRIHWPKTGVPRLKQYADEFEGVTLQDMWTDIRKIHNQSAELLDYPTQKPEALLERIVLASSNTDDLVMDCFSGSGTAAAVAEKLGRRWIVCDYGKHAIYTMQKRMLEIAKSKPLNADGKNVGARSSGDREYGRPPKPFVVVSVGAYDFSRIMELRKNKDAYVSFVLGIFGITREDLDLTQKYKLPNIYAEKNNDPVEVYPVWEDEYLKEVRIDEEYLKGIIEASGGKLKGDYYIIVPETCTVVGDTVLKNRHNERVTFRLLKFPYKILEDISRHFQIEEQPSSEADINKLISSSAFYFNEEIDIKIARASGGLRIASFESRILNKDRERFHGLDALAMVLIDKEYDGKVFDMDNAIYKKDIGDDGLVKVEGLTKKNAVIAIDKHGNESKVTTF